MMSGQAALCSPHDLSRSPWLRMRPLLLLCTCLSLVPGCNALNVKPPSAVKTAKTDKAIVLALPNKNQLRVSQFLLYADFELKADTPLFQELAELPEQVYKELQLPQASSLVQVYLFDNRDGYETFMKARYPDLPKRRAFFVAQPHAVGGAEDLLVFTYWGERSREDLRHELTHALLHSVLKDVPLWLDEGIAEYFEVPPDWQGINPRHLEQMRLQLAATFRPNLRHLEQVGQVSQMSPADYREAWAWVHFMLNSKAEARDVLISYLQQLRSNPSPGPFQPRLAAVIPDLDSAFNQHLAKLETARLPPRNAKN